MAEDEIREHESLAAEARVLDDAIAKAQRLDRDAVAAVENVQRFLTLRFLPHARHDAEVCAWLALRDHRHPDGRCGEPEVEMMATRLDHIHEALAGGDFSEGVGMLLHTLLRELQPFLHGHLGDSSSSEASSTARAESGIRKG